MLEHLFWLLTKEIGVEPQRRVWLRDLLLDIYVWWAEGVHLCPQPRRGRGARHWDPGYINELLEQALPFDPDEVVEPIPGTTLDTHLGYALMLMSAAVHAVLLDRPRTADPVGSLRAEYRHIGSKVRFAPGGLGLFRLLCRESILYPVIGDFPLLQN